MNVELPIKNLLCFYIQHSMLGVECSMFIFFLQPATRTALISHHQALTRGPYEKDISPID
jgi:hypothetical protein